MIGGNQNVLSTNLQDDLADQVLILDDVVLLVGIGTVTSILRDVETDASDLFLTADLFDDGGAEKRVLASVGSFLEGSTGGEDVFGTSGQVGRVGDGGRDGEGQREGENGADSGGETHFDEIEKRCRGVEEARGERILRL